MACYCELVKKNRSEMEQLSLSETCGTMRVVLTEWSLSVSKILRADMKSSKNDKIRSAY